MIYEFVTPSDPVTFCAEDDKIAFACALLIRNGKALCTREDGKKLKTAIVFSGEEEVEKELGVKVEALDVFISAHREAVAACLESFAYGDVEDRQQYEDAIAAITDPEKLKEFKAKHEDRRRTSMSQWVKFAWQVAERVRAQGKEEACG